MHFSAIGTVAAVRGKASAYFNPERIEPLCTRPGAKATASDLHRLIETCLASMDQNKPAEVSVLWSPYDDIEINIRSIQEFIS